MDRSFDRTTSSLDKQELGTTGLRAITQRALSSLTQSLMLCGRKLSHVIAFKVPKSESFPPEPARNVKLPHVRFHGLFCLSVTPYVLLMLQDFKSATPLVVELDLVWEPC